MSLKQKAPSKSPKFHVSLKIIWILFISLSLFFLLSQKAFSAEVTIDDTIRNGSYEYNSGSNVVFTSADVGYVFFVSQSIGITGQVAYRKTIDGGNSWGTPVQIGTTSPGKIWNNIAVWYDRWTQGDDTGTKIYITAVEATTDDGWFNYIDTADSDSQRPGGWNAAILGTRYDATADGSVSITKTSNGDIYIMNFGTLTGLGDGCQVFRSVDGGDNFSNTTLAMNNGMDDIDFGQILPLSDNDILLIYQDTSRDEMFSKIYDIGTTLWIDESSIGTSIVDNGTYDLPWGSALRKSDSSIFLTVNDHVGGFVDANIRTYQFSNTSRTWDRKTNVQSRRPYSISAKPGINASDGSIYVVYISGVISDTTDVYYKISYDDGDSWSPQSVQLNNTSDDYKNVSLDMYNNNILYAIWYDTDDSDIFGSAVPFEINASPIPDSSTIDATIADATNEYNPSPNIVYTTEDIGYVFYIESDVGSSTPVFSKTTDGGDTWSNPIQITTNLPTTGFRGNSIAIWYDQWTPGDDTGTKIHIALVDDTVGYENLYYASLDTSSDTQLSDLVLVADGAGYDPAADGNVSIVKEGSGNILVSAHGNYASVDTQVIYRSDIGASGWANTNFSLTGGLDDSDFSQLVPFTTTGALIIVQDLTARTTISRIYSETTSGWLPQQSIGMPLYGVALYDGNWGATYNRLTNDIYLTGAYRPGNAANDVYFYEFTVGTTTWSNVGDIVTNDAGYSQSNLASDQNTGDLYLTYTRGTVGGDTDVYFRISRNGGVDWESETRLNTLTDDIKYVRTGFMSKHRIGVVWFNDDLNDIITNSMGISRYNQRSFRFFQNINAIGATTPFTATNVGWSLPSSSNPFRLKMLIKSEVSETSLDKSFKLQYAPLLTDCASSTYSDISASSENIRFNDNASLGDGDTIPYGSNDPKDGSTTIIPQTYQENNDFSNSHYSFVRNRNSVWDFSLTDFGASAGSSYCFRAVLGNGNTLSSYSYYPQITLPSTGISISGTLYTDDDESAPIHNETVCVAVNSAFNPSNCDTTDSGEFIINGISATSGGEVLTLFATGTHKSNLVTIGSGDNLSGLKMYQNHVSLRYETGTSISIEPLTSYDNDQNSEHILFNAQNLATDTLEWENDIELFIPSSFTFAPNGNISGHDLEIDGIFTASSGNTISLSGTFKLDSSATFNSSTSSLNMTASSGIENIITLGTGNLYDLNISASDGFPVFRIQDDITISHDLTITSGTLDVVSGEDNTITLGGDWTNDDIFAAQEGQVILNGSATVSLDSGCADTSTCDNQAFYDLVLNKDNSGDNINLINSDLLVLNSLILTSGTLNQSGSDIRIQGATSVSIGDDGRWSNQSTGDISLGGSLSNSGLISLVSNGSCGGNNDIEITSNSGTPAWSGSGTFDLKDLVLSNQSATVSISLFSSTNNGGNTGSWLFYPTCTTGSLLIDIVDADGQSKSDPSISLQNKAFSMSYQNTNGIFGETNQKMRINNTTADSDWTLSIAADSGNTALWASGSDHYDFNDPTSGAVDGEDPDSYGGRLSFDPTTASINPESGCTTDGISLGSFAAFNQGITDDLTLTIASTGAQVGCYWDILGIDLLQSIPANQSPSDYSINLTLTVTAN